MDQIPGGFWRVIAEDFIHDRRNKTFFGRIHLKLGVLVGGLWPYLLELGGVLGARHALKVDAFVSAFLGMSGAAGAARRFLVESAGKVLEEHSVGSMTFSDYVGRDFADRLGYQGKDCSSLIMERGTKKVPPDIARSQAWSFASRGAALGATHPDILRSMFERTHVEVPKEEWQQAYAAGLDIGPEQPRIRNYREAEEEQNKNFLEYCREFHPDLYSRLND